jgi:hypothetical protein
LYVHTCYTIARRRSVAPPVPMSPPCPSPPLLPLHTSRTSQTPEPCIDRKSGSIGSSSTGMRYVHTTPLLLSPPPSTPPLTPPLHSSSQPPPLTPPLAPWTFSVAFWHAVDSSGEYSTSGLLHTYATYYIHTATCYIHMPPLTAGWHSLHLLHSSTLGLSSLSHLITNM